MVAPTVVFDIPPLRWVNGCKRGTSFKRSPSTYSYLSQSSILTNSLNNIINTLVSAKVDEDGNVIEEGMLGNVVLVGFESGAEWNETEIASIFKALVTILKSDLIGSEDYVSTLSTLSDCTINDLATSLSGSKFIRNNLSEIISEKGKEAATAAKKVAEIANLKGRIAGVETEIKKSYKISLYNTRNREYYSNSRSNWS